MATGATKASPKLRVTDQVPTAVALAFLRGDPRENVYLISRIHRSGMSDGRNPAHGRFLGAFDEDQSLRGLLFSGNSGTLVIAVDEPWVAGEFVEPMLDSGWPFSILVTGFDAGRAFLTRFKKRSGRKPSLDRKQIFYVLDRSSLASSKEVKEIDMEQASLDSIDELTQLACAMVTEDLKLEPGVVDRRHYRLRMTEKVMEGRAYLCRNGDKAPIFKCDLNVVGTDGALMEGVYTPTEHRGNGIATRALWTLCKDLLQRKKIPFVALHVDERNKAARKAYETVGFKEVGAYRLTLIPRQL
jgi:hypothetical protein